MTFKNPSREVIAEVLKNSKTIAVVGLSDKPHRTSYQISKAMQEAGYRIIPVNPTINEALGEKAVAQLSDITESIDIINVFRRSEFLPDVAKEASAIPAQAFWGQQGVIHEEAYEELKDKDMTVIMDVCIKVAHAVYM